MSSSGEYLYDDYIQDDYSAEQDRVNKESANITESTTEAREMSPKTSRKKRISRYDENMYALPDVDEKSPPPASLANTLPEVIISKPKAIV